MLFSYLFVCYNIDEFIYLMDKTTHQFQLLSDILGDLIGDDNVSPHEIVGAIKEELTDLLEYHQQNATKVERVLSLFAEDEPKNFSKDVSYENLDDIINFNKYKFNLDSDYLNTKLSWNDFLKDNNK